MSLIDRRVIAHFDFILFLVSILIPLIGLVVLYSASYDPNVNISAPLVDISIKSPAFVEQATYLTIGLLAMLAGMSLSSQFLQRWSYVIYGLGILLLVGVLIFGTVSHGSRRWFSLAGINFQPSELMEICLILTLARYLSKVKIPPGGFGITKLITPFLIALVPMGLVVYQPDLGTALSIGAVGFMMVFFVGIRPKSLLLVTLIAIISIAPLWHYSLHDYQKRRVLALINPEADPRGSGYHLIQSKIAVGSGSLLGKGFLRGTQTQLQFLPEHTTDFVFSVLAEEWGFLGAFLVLALYFWLIYLVLRIGLKCRDNFGALVSFGVAALLFFHVIVNVGMVVGLLPIVGLTLPLFSYGGSSVLCFMFAIGIVQGVSMRRYLFSQGGY